MISTFLLNSDPLPNSHYRAGTKGPEYYTGVQCVEGTSQIDSSIASKEFQTQEKNISMCTHDCFDNTLMNPIATTSSKLQ